MTTTPYREPVDLPQTEPEDLDAVLAEARRAAGVEVTDAQRDGLSAIAEPEVLALSVPGGGMSSAPTPAPLVRFINAIAGLRAEKKRGKFVAVVGSGYLLELQQAVAVTADAVFGSGPNEKHHAVLANAANGEIAGILFGVEIVHDETRPADHLEMVPVPRPAVPTRETWLAMTDEERRAFMRAVVG